MLLQRLIFRALILGVTHLEAKLEHAQNQMLQQDRIVRGTEEKEKDLNEALKAKDSQLAVLRVRMQEADEELASKRELVMKLTTENQRQDNNVVSPIVLLPSVKGFFLHELPICGKLGQ